MVTLSDPCVVVMAQLCYYIHINYYFHPSGVEHYTLSIPRQTLGEFRKLSLRVDHLEGATGKYLTFTVCDKSRKSFSHWQISTARATAPFEHTWGHFTSSTRC